MNKSLGIAMILTMSILIHSNPALAAKKLSRISDSVFAYNDIRNASPINSFGANAGIVIGQEGVVVVDTLAGSLTGEALTDASREIAVIATRTRTGLPK